MNTVTYQPNYWHYLTGDFLNRVHPRFRKAVKTFFAVVLQFDLRYHRSKVKCFSASF